MTANLARRLIGAAMLVVATTATAQNDTQLTKIISYATPASPALALIGGSADKISRPTSAKDIATSFANAVNESGKVVQGLAVEFGSGLLARQMDRETYRSVPGFIRANMAFSIGSAKVAGDSSSTNLALGVRATLLNHADPFFRRGATVVADLLGCLRLGDPNSSEPIGKQKPVRGCYDKVAAADSADQAKWEVEHWNAWSVGIASAYATQLKGSEFGNTSRFGWTASAVVAAPLCFSDDNRAGMCKNGQWFFQLAHDARDSLSKTDVELDRTSLGTRLNLGTDRVGFFAEYLSARYGATAAMKARTASEWSTGIEWRATDDVWVSTGLGNRYNAAIGKEKAVVMAGLHFNTYSKRKFAAAK